MIECCLTNQSGTLHASNHWLIPFKHECPSRNLTGITYCIGVSLSCKNTDFFHTESQVISYTKIRRYSAQILCSILRFISSVHGSDPLSVRFFPFSRKTGANYLYIGLSLSFQLSGFLLIFSVNVKLFRACHLSKKGETFLPRDFYSIVKLESFQPAALISRADFFLHLSNGWNASFHMPLLFLPVCPPNSSVGRKVVRFSCHRIHSFLLWTWLPPHPLLVISKGLPSF